MANRYSPPSEATRTLDLASDSPTSERRHPTELFSYDPGDDAKNDRATVPWPIIPITVPFPPVGESPNSAPSTLYPAVFVCQPGDQADREIPRRGGREKPPSAADVEHLGTRVATALRKSGDEDDVARWVGEV